MKMKTWISGMGVLSLCACSSAPVTETSFTSGFSLNGIDYMSPPASLNDPRLYRPQFYMDDDTSPAEQAYRYYFPMR